MPPRRHLLIALLYLLVSGFFFHAFYERYWKWRHEIDQATSSFITSDGDNLTSGGMFWIIPAVIFASAALGRFIKFGRATLAPKSSGLR